jgi:hypothetical protein
MNSPVANGFTTFALDSAIQAELVWFPPHRFAIRNARDALQYAQNFRYFGLQVL